MEPTSEQIGRVCREFASQLCRRFNLKHVVCDPVDRPAGGYEATLKGWYRVGRAVHVRQGKEWAIWYQPELDRFVTREYDV